LPRRSGVLTFFIPTFVASPGHEARHFGRHLVWDQTIYFTTPQTFG
jgi:hypothetical protein